MTSTLTFRTFISAICLIAGSNALAESGDYEMLYSFVTNFSKLEQPGRTITAGSINGTQTILKSSGGPFQEGANNITDCVLYAKKLENALDLESYCTSVDPSGDKLFAMGQRKSGADLNAGGSGTVKILGGTGRYADISGTCTYKTEYLANNHVVNHNKCQWQKP